MLEYINWFNFFVVELCGSAIVALLLTLGIYLFTLMMGKVSFQMIIIYLLVSGTYFASLLFPGRWIMLLLVFCSLVFIVWESMKTINRGDTG